MNMSKDEFSNAINQMRSATSDLRGARECVLNTAEHINKKLEEKYLPINLEHDILCSIQASIHDAIKSSLSGYDSPMKKLVLRVVAKYESDLLKVIDESFYSVIKTDEFKKAILDGFSHKVARTIISNNDGLFEKVSNDLKQDQTFKAKMTLAVANVVNECLNESK